jgi:hypothetical protein
MNLRDPFQHMEEAWKLDRNPFPADGIRRPGDPFSEEVFHDENTEFRRKLVRGAVLGNRGVGFLWSRGIRADTGFGKTTLMMECANDINENLGRDVLEAAGMRPQRMVPIAATYTNLNSLDTTGLYPVLFQAVVDAAKAHDEVPALFQTLHERLGVSDPGQVRDAVLAARLRVAPGATPLRPELVAAFADDGADGVLRQLSLVSGASRLRNGLQYLDFLVTVADAAGIEHLFVFVDQLEDLATNKSVTSAKRSREIGRIRDLLELEPYASRVHFVFTFHNSAAQVLERYWEANRLPDFEPSPRNTAAVVVLHGLKEDRQVADLLRVYLERDRMEQLQENDELLPFEAGALTVLREVSEGRVGILLSRAHELLNAAAEAGRPVISADFARTYFDDQGITPSGPDDEPGASPAQDFDDLILG